MKKNGFTLTELLSVLVILGVISTIAVVSYSDYIKKSSDTAYKTGEETLRAAGESFLTYCSSSINSIDACKGIDIPVRTESVEISINTLIKNGFMEPIQDAKDNSSCGGSVKITNNSPDGSKNYHFEYKTCLSCSNYKSKDCSE